MNNLGQIVDEIRQIRDQFQKEVLGRFRAWPESLKARILELAEAGWSVSKIFQQTGVPVPTIYTWRRGRVSRAKSTKKGGGRFVAIEVSRAPTSDLAVNRERKDLKVQEESHSRNGYVFLLPGNIRIEGLSLDPIV